MLARLNTRPSRPRPIVPVEAASDGVVELPAGKIATVATYLAMTRAERPVALATPSESKAAFEPIGRDLPRYRALYAAVGEPWLWFSRARMTDAALAAVVGHAAVEALALVEDGRDVGILELDFRRPPDCELAFLGLTPDAIGAGRGRALVAEAIGRAFARATDRLWLHTCTLDAPGALDFYRAAGFTPYRRAVEIGDDPRVTGVLPPGAAPRHPIL